MSKTITMGQIQDGGKPLTLNVDSLVESKLLVQANSGGGKSNTIRLLSEKLAPIMPFVIIDPEGEFATLREKVDLVLVGEGGELATTPQNAGQIALKLLDLGVSAVIDLFHLVPAQRREWVRRYCENIVAAPKKMWRPFALFIDEAQMFAPQDGDSVSHGPVVEMMTLARKRDLCAILVTPRLAALATDARAPVNNFLIGRATLDVDYKRAGEILGMAHAERRTLASLKKGEFHAFGPSFGHDGVAFVHLDKAETRPAKTGTAMKAVPAPSAAIRAVVPELEALAQPANPDEVGTIEAAKARIKALKVELAAASKAARAPAPTSLADPKAIEKAVAKAVFDRDKYWAEEVHRLRKNANKLRPLAASLQATIDAIEGVRVSLDALPAEPPAAAAARTFFLNEQHTTVVPKREPRVHTNGHAAAAPEGLSSRHAEVLTAVRLCHAMGYEAPTREQVMFWSDKHGSNFRNLIGALRSAGEVEYPSDGTIRATKEGDVPDRDQAYQKAMAALESRMRSIVDYVLSQDGPRSRDQVAEATDKHGSNLRNLLGALRSAGLIEYPSDGMVEAAAWLREAAGVGA